MARAAVGLFTSGAERKSYETWLDRGGLALLQKSVAAWEDGSFLTPGDAARIAVGFTVLNRMRRNGTTHVHDVWHAYAYGVHPSEATVGEAKLVLCGTIPDPTNGATHFYSPVTMPKEGEVLPRHADISGGLEQVPGVTQGGRQVRNYRPSYAVLFTPKAGGPVDAKDFKFYQQPGTGKVG